MSAKEMKEAEDLIFIARELKKEVKIKSGALNKIKEELRIFLVDSGIKKYNGVEIRRVISFDAELFRLENPKVGEALYKKTETITVDWKLSKKNKDIIKTKYPDKYKSCLEEQTARLYGL